MRLMNGIVTAMAGAFALAAAVYAGPEPPPPPPLCTCREVTQWGTCNNTFLGSASQTLTCTVVNNASCNIGGAITWVPANPQCTTFGTSYWGMPQTAFSPALALGTQIFNPVGSVNCGGSVPFPVVHGFINIPGTLGCALDCRRVWDCAY